MNIRVSAEDAGWTVREAVWGLEERVLWRGSDVTRGALGRAGRVMRPLQRLIQTRLTWPVADVLNERGGRTRAAIAAGAAAIAIAAAAGGAMSATHHPYAPKAIPAAASVTAAPQASGVIPLQGVTPRFQAGNAPAAPPPQPPAKTAAPPAQVAWQFAQAFVGYEVGHSGKKAGAAFAATATKPLAKSLAADPPRLPATGKVPQARVLNVVLGAAGKEQVTASVSLVRLRAISEVRLTLTKSGDQWRVAQVLG
ncbi:MAG: hypothetical protein QOD14_940 [Solirubrobacterales bacterium]|nr:hypothetical protein [Solirubrobacterales bacterium]